jgi:hypothetical protein
MPLRVYRNIYASGSVPQNWAPSRGRTLKYPVANKQLLQHLRQLAKGKWQKVIKGGTTGEVHFFEHQSGQVAGVKFLPRDVTDESN